MLAIYDFLGGITNGGKNPFFSSIRRIAVYFGMNYEAARRSLKQLRKFGFVELETDGHLRYVPHDEWAKAHPGKCTTRDLFHWQESTDPLVGEIWKISKSKIRLMDWQIEAVRKHIADDALFIQEFRNEMAAASARRVPGGDWGGTSPKACFWRVYNRLKDEVASKSTVGVPAHR